MTGRRIDADAVRAALTVDLVWSDAGSPLAARRQARTAACPVGGTHGRRDAVNVDRARGLWSCFRCGGPDHPVGGDALAALAGFRGLDVHRDFPRLIELAADLAGVVPDDTDARTATERARDREHRQQAHRAELARRQAEDDAARAAAIDRARGLWPTLAREDDRGRRYLDGRGLDATGLIAADVVRFWPDGSPAVALHDEAGEIISVVRRVLAPGDGPKVLGLRGCPTAGTLVGRVPDIAAGALVVVCEGVADSLAATLAWPRAVVLGAHGANRYPLVAGLAAARLVAVGGGRLALSVDDDDTGRTAGERAIEAIADTGLDLAAVEVIELDEAHDLADAWRDGWRP